MPAPAAPQEDPTLLNLFCVKVGDAWRVHVWPTGLPSYLRDFFDENGEAYPVELDFDDLDRYMAAQGASFEKSVSRLGGVELTARHPESRAALGVWLSNAFASGRRPGPRGGSREGS